MCQRGMPSKRRRPARRCKCLEHIEGTLSCWPDRLQAGTCPHRKRRKCSLNQPHSGCSKCPWGICCTCSGSQRPPGRSKCLGSTRRNSIPRRHQASCPTSQRCKPCTCLRPRLRDDHSRSPEGTCCSCSASMHPSWRSKCPWGKHCSCLQTKPRANRSTSRRGKVSTRQGWLRQRSWTNCRASTPCMRSCRSSPPHFPIDQLGNSGMRCHSERLAESSKCPECTSGKCSHQTLRGHCSMSRLGSGCNSSRPQRCRSPRRT